MKLVMGNLLRAMGKGLWAKEAFLSLRPFTLALSPLLIILLLSTTAHASDDAAQPLRNAAVESANVSHALAAASKAKGLEKAYTDAQITKQSKDLEAVLLSTMIEPMFPDGKHSDLYGGGMGSDIFRTMLIQEYGKTFADAGGIGLAKNIEKEVRRHKGE